MWDIKCNKNLYKRTQIWKIQPCLPESLTLVDICCAYSRNAIPPNWRTKTQQQQQLLLLNCCRQRQRQRQGQKRINIIREELFSNRVCVCVCVDSYIWQYQFHWSPIHMDEHTKNAQTKIPYIHIWNSIAIVVLCGKLSRQVSNRYGRIDDIGYIYLYRAHTRVDGFSNVWLRKDLAKKVIKMCSRCIKSAIRPNPISTSRWSFSPISHEKHSKVVFEQRNSSVCYSTILHRILALPSTFLHNSTAFFDDAIIPFLLKHSNRCLHSTEIVKFRHICM